ncbi:hypothetical protein [Marinilabilia rubra]|uniref:Glycosyl transferase family 28 C-terminal domain-containing protein n=1 Tax=Marinilabilia rubra TaxID=2162893 RepID=A0A2U2B3P4_9BACT|nr:hypothetical protein [Marinilabilia rubra]PWD97683.1 hypothetical protein DDZ16_19525 [Marinilabilia rubra]
MGLKSFEKGKIAFLTEANLDIGYGHLYRSVALAQKFFSNKFDVDFFCDGFVPAKIIRENLPESNVFELPRFKALINKYSLVILDVFKNSWLNYQWIAQTTDIKTASVIDYAFKDYSIPTDYIFQIGFQPYRFNEEVKPKENGEISKVYSGNDFFIFREEFEGKKAFEIKKNAKKILVSMGGSDPYGLTEFVSNSLINIKTPLIVTFIFGAAIKEKRITNINSIFSNSCHDLRVCQNVKIMSKIMENHDCAIINGGNTRFEMAVVGIPFISISFNNQQNNIANYLQNYGIGENLGIYKNLNSKVVAKSIERFIYNYAERKKMSEQMRKSICINGTQNILNILLA